MAERVSSQQISSFLQSIGFNAIQAAGITGNLAVESANFDPNVLSGKRRGDNGTAFGLMQWRGSRQNNFFRFAREINRDPYDWRTQLLFVKAEMIPNSRYTDPGSVRAAQELSRAKNVYESTRAFIHAERPAGYTGANPERAMHFKERFAAAQSAVGNPSRTSDTGAGQDQMAWDQQSSPLEGIGDFQLGESYDNYDSMLDNGQYSMNGQYGRNQFDGTNPLGYSDFGANSPFNMTGGYSNANNMYEFSSPSFDAQVGVDFGFRRT